MDHISAPSLPRKQIVACGDIAQQHTLYVLYKAFYLNVSWGQRVVYKAISSFIDPETRAKIHIDGTHNPESMTQLFHPCQLEQRFGGEVPTPTNFWPPYIGPKFIPDRVVGDHPNLIPQERYREVINENTELLVHPHFMTPDRCSNMHYKLPDVT